MSPADGAGVVSVVSVMGFSLFVGC
jgi:hypothetical protein